MSDTSKVKPNHIQRAAFVYIRQSSPTQVAYNRESTARQYALVEKACQLGWSKEQVMVIDDDLGVSGAGFVERSGFARMTADVALGHAGIVFALEVSRVARNNADWYRLFDLCSITDTLTCVGSEVAHRVSPTLATVRRSNRACRFPALATATAFTIQRCSMIG
jgi:hypothetical protein